MRRRYGPSPAMKPVALLQTSTFAVPAASSTIEPLTARGSRVAARIPAHPARTPDARAEPGGYAAMLLICVASATRRLGAGRRRPGLPRRRQRTRATPAVFANASVLRCDLPREGLGDDLPILYHEGTSPLSRSSDPLSPSSDPRKRAASRSRLMIEDHLMTPPVSQIASGAPRSEEHTSELQSLA